MFTQPPFIESSDDSLPLRIFPQPHKFNVSTYSVSVTDTGAVLRTCPVLPLGSGPNDRTTPHIRILSQVIKYNFSKPLGQTNPVFPVVFNGDAVRVIYVIDKLCGLMSGNGSWLPPSDNSSGGHLLGAKTSTPRMTTLACKNHSNAHKFAFLHDVKHDTTRKFSGYKDAAGFLIDPVYISGAIRIYGIDIDVQYTDDGTGYAGNVPFLSLSSDNTSHSCQIVVSTVFIDHF